MATADRARSSNSESGVGRSRRLISRMPGTVEAYGGSMPTGSALATFDYPCHSTGGPDQNVGGSSDQAFHTRPLRATDRHGKGSSGAPNWVSLAREHVTISSALLPPPLGGFGQLPKK
jgi:hypothetical protein